MISITNRETVRRDKFALAAAIVLALGFPSSVSAGTRVLGSLSALCWGVVDYNDAQLERRKHIPRRCIPQNVL